MQQVHYIIRDNGDGSQSAIWYKGSIYSYDQLYEAAELDKYDAYQSGDGIQITTLSFPDYFNLDEIGGIDWCGTLPDVYEY